MSLQHGVGKAVNWDDLKVLLAVARAGSLTKAALMLEIDQTTAGRRLTALEAELGGSLFVRSKSGFAPTESGRTAIEHASDVELRLERMAEELNGGERGASGLIRLLGNSWTLQRIAALALPGLLRVHPKLDVRVVTLNTRSPLRSEPTVSLWFEAPVREPEFAIKLGEVAYAVYAARSLAPKALGWVSYHDEDAPRLAPALAMAELRQEGEPLRLTATDGGVLLAAIKAGAGKGLLPICVANDHPDLARVTDGPPDLVRTLHLHLHPDTVQLARVRVVTECLREAFAAVFVP